MISDVNEKTINNEVCLRDLTEKDFQYIKSKRLVKSHGRYRKLFDAFLASGKDKQVIDCSYSSIVYGSLKHDVKMLYIDVSVKAINHGIILVRRDALDKVFPPKHNSENR